VLSGASPKHDRADIGRQPHFERSTAVSASSTPFGGTVELVAAMLSPLEPAAAPEGCEERPAARKNGLLKQGGRAHRREVTALHPGGTISTGLVNADQAPRDVAESAASVRLPSQPRAHLERNAGGT
jgi:hypothetical protein